ncbi:unnamed protein product, partial [Ilex paraguariensis]
MSSAKLIKPLLCLLCVLLLRIEASVHNYAAERFLSKGNAFVIHGGSEEITPLSPIKTELPSLQMAMLSY